MTSEERDKIKDALDVINDRLQDIRDEYAKANDDEDYASANDLDCGPFVNTKYELGKERDSLRAQRDLLRAQIQA